MYTFCKQERLCSQKRIDALFQSGHRIMVFPYSIHWQVCPNGTLPEGVPAQVLIATSKRKFHHAVDRNGSHGSATVYTNPLSTNSSQHRMST